MSFAEIVIKLKEDPLGQTVELHLSFPVKRIYADTRLYLS
jgi:hypothetical protein